MGVIGGGKKEHPSLLSRRQQGLSGWALTGQASPDALPQSQATLQPALTWRPTAGGGQRPVVSMLGRAGMCHYFGWLGTVVLLAVGCMKEWMGLPH